MSTYYPDHPSNTPSTLDSAVIKGVTLNVSSIETLYCLDSDHLPVLLKMGTAAGGSPRPTIKITNWNGVSAALEEIDTLSLNSIPDDMNKTDEIDSVIGALTNHARTVVGNNVREVPAFSNHRKYPADVLESLKEKHSFAPRKRISYCRV
ncbi:Probable RNA-directed DNA polymerase from transposon BS [Eumeta japonica]|uniref:Probable RNA-directed DNA polymerase from transposon BS n=1 Tax=Eumeta variegata TaxID=151549 RepID=A0A4C1X3C8_EUMVA|nr:Probable RNA-directed DNA polymerase from transposon BS [Eumeta japonica]